MSFINKFPAMLKAGVFGGVVYFGFSVAYGGGGHEHSHSAHQQNLLEGNQLPNPHHGQHKGHAHHGHGHGVHHSKVGSPASASEATKTVGVTMLDSMRFEFRGLMEIQTGDVVRFQVENKGDLVHEFSIGTLQEHRVHGAMMRKMPDMVHEDGNTLSLAPGAKGEITWRFHGDPEVVFGCNVPGHLEAGMSRSIKVK